MHAPTPYIDVNITLHSLLAEVQNILGENMLGLYLYGSLATGDFDPNTSDIDFLVVTTCVLPEAQINALKDLHTRLAASDQKWDTKLEGTYLAQQALPRYVNEPNQLWPSVNERQFFLAPHGWDWIIQRHTLRLHNLALSGPDLTERIDPVSPAALRQAVCGILHDWWAPIVEDPTWVRGSEYQAFAVLSMCRSLNTLRHGTMLSKLAAARWAQAELPEPWPQLVTQALAWRPGIEMNEVEQVRRFIAMAVEESKAQPG